MSETVNRELYLAAALLARPELVPALFPPSLDGDGDLRLLSNRTARAAISVLATQGPAYANPAALQSALADLPVELPDDDVVALMALIPERSAVTLEDLVELKDQIARQSRQKELAQALILAGTRLRQSEDYEALDDVQRAIANFQRGNVGRDPSAAGILERMKRGQVTARWKVGCPLLDELNQGIGPNGEFSCGVAGQGETIVVSAKYGTGKTRLTLNWLVELLAQGANITLLAGEDNEAAYALKLMGIRFNLEKYILERYIINRVSFLDKHGQEMARKCEEAQSWFASLRPKLRIYDSSAKVNIFRFHQAKALLEEDHAVYGTTHVLIDYAQIWKGEVFQLEQYAQDMREFAGRNNVGLIILSQIPNQAMDGVQPGRIPSKGTSEWGQIAHTGFYLEQDFTVGQKEIKIIQSKGRDAGSTVVYAEMNPLTGKVLRYKGTPDWFPLPEDPTKARARGRR